MIKIDLITGFLGSGKTTFLKRYVTNLKKDYKVAIIENDFGPINVDIEFLKDLIDDRCDIFTVTGCNHPMDIFRRLKSKLITMKMLGFNRIVIEPSGIFIIDHFMDLMNDDDLYDNYEIGNIITVVDSNLDLDLSKESKYILCSELSCSGHIEISKKDLYPNSNVVNYLKDILKEFKCNKDIDSLLNNDYINCGYQIVEFEKYNIDICDTFKTMFYMNKNISLNSFKEMCEYLFDNYKINRVKGFIYDNGYYEINSTKNEYKVNLVSECQKVIIIIGEMIDTKEIDNNIKGYFKED